MGNPTAVNNTRDCLFNNLTLDGTNQNADSDWEYEQYFVESNENDLTQEKDWKIVVEISGKTLEMKLDTGSQVKSIQ